MRDTALALRGIGGSEVAALCGLDPNRDAFAIYAEKLGLVEKEEPTPRMRAGRRFEKPICEWYAETTGYHVIWSDITMAPVESRPWQLATVDAFVENGKSATERGIVDCKLVALDQFYQWGEEGSDEVPDRYALQLQWYLSAFDLQWGDIAAAMGPYNLRIYRIERDPEIETTLLEVAERFWTENVLAQVPPPIGHSDTAARYLRQRFPWNTQNIRQASPDECLLLSRYKNERAVRDEAIARCKDVENEVKAAIGDADGLEDPVLGRVTYKYIKEQVGPDWKEIAWAILADWKEGYERNAIPELEEYEELHQHVVRQGFRRLNCPRTWKTMGDNED